MADMWIKPEIILTEDGSHSLRHPVSGEAYHSLHGARTEAVHVFINNGLRYCLAENGGKGCLNILEAGFGSGLNAWLTISEAERMGVKVNYTAVELYPVDTSVIEKTGYASYPRFLDMHRAGWGTPVAVSPLFTLTKLNSDLTLLDIDTTFDLVYFDMFAPDVCPGLWSTDVFSAVYGYLTAGGVLVTYSAKGDVKRALRTAGFEVLRLPGAPGKRHMLRAVKK